VFYATNTSSHFSCLSTKLFSGWAVTALDNAANLTPGWPFDQNKNGHYPGMLMDTLWGVTLALQYGWDGPDGHNGSIGVVPPWRISQMLSGAPGTSDPGVLKGGSGYYFEGNLTLALTYSVCLPLSSQSPRGSANGNWNSTTNTFDLVLGPNLVYDRDTLCKCSLQLRIMPVVYYVWPQGKFLSARPDWESSALYLQRRLADKRSAIQYFRLWCAAVGGCKSRSNNPNSMWTRLADRKLYTSVDWALQSDATTSLDSVLAASMATGLSRVETQYNNPAEEYTLYRVRTSYYGPGGLEKLDDIISVILFISILIELWLAYILLRGHENIDWSNPSTIFGLANATPYIRELEGASTGEFTPEQLSLVVAVEVEENEAKLVNSSSAGGLPI
jgi:hypothetical protein